MATPLVIDGLKQLKWKIGHSNKEMVEARAKMIGIEIDK
jgi:hypothetical protein